VHTIVMDMTNDGAVEPVFAGLNRVDLGLISAGTICHGSMDTVTTLPRER
jgi:hypothetical protein